jgi:hypothetical protein
MTKDPASEYMISINSGLLTVTLLAAMIILISTATMAPLMNFEAIRCQQSEP